MKKIITINVTKKDIAEGIRLRGERCPIALAAKRKSKGRAIVFPEYIVIERSLMKGTFKLPPKAKRFIIDFDGNKPVRPFKFEIRTTK